jgi:hypothetical protein
VAPWPVFVAVGVAIGTLTGFFGVGGSSVATPMLSLLGVQGLLAIASPLPATIPSALAAAVPYVRNRTFRPKAAAWSLVGGVPAGATHTTKDCSIVSGGGAVTTTTNAAPTTTTSTIAPPTTTTSVVPTTTTAPPTTTTSTTSAPTTTTTAPHNQAPAFTSDDATTFRHGVFGSFTVTVSGSPRPSLRVSGSLPFGVSFNHTNGVLSGTPKKSGYYRLTLTASNGIRPNAIDRFMLIVD